MSKIGDFVVGEMDAGRMAEPETVNDDPADNPYHIPHPPASARSTMLDELARAGVTMRAISNESKSISVALAELRRDLEDSAGVRIPPEIVMRAQVLQHRTEGMMALGHSILDALEAESEL